MQYLYGLHEPGGEKVVGLPAGSHIVFTHALGHDPTHVGGYDYRKWANDGYLCLARLNNGYFPNGTIPQQQYYIDFAQRVANWVQSSLGCNHWIIGNEPNHSQERPHGEVITAEMYAICFNLCETAIRGVQPDAVVIPAAVAPWNPETGDWLEYFETVLNLCNGFGAIAIHTYTHGSDPALITSTQTMDYPFEDRYYNFRAYMDFMERIPPSLEHLPVYITETDQDQPWEDVNSGWVQAAYKEIDQWNELFVPIIHGLTLFRWPMTGDGYHIDGRNGVIADMRDAIEYDYAVPEKEQPPVSENLVINPSYEGTYYVWESASALRVLEPIRRLIVRLTKWRIKGVPQHEVKIAPNWSPWWHQTDTRPEYKPATLAIDARRVRTGQKAQQWFNNYATHTAGVYQKVHGVEPGRTLNLSGWVQCFSSNKDDFAQSDGRYRMRIGIDPYGGTNPESSDILWSDTVQPYDAYQMLELEFIAKSDRVTVFSWGQPEWPLKHNNAYIDDFELVYVGGGVEPPIPPIEGECDFTRLYTLKSKEAEILEGAYSTIAQLYRNET